MLSKRKDAAMSDKIWQDREILFDVDTKSLRLIPGEYLVEKIENVEDTKGNNGDKGTLRITNIRIIWHANTMPRINLSIGYNSIHGVTTRILKSKIRGHAESLYIMARNNTTRFEFVFTCANPNHTKLFTTVIGIHRAFETTKLYRELKMRGALVDNEGRLRVLPLEHQIDRIEGAWNLSSEQGNLGVLIITNIRVVWYSSMNSLYNVGSKYSKSNRNMSCRDSKFGTALVMETSIQSGEYILGFRIDPEDLLETTSKQIQSFHTAFSATPIFGVQYSKDKTAPFNPEEHQQQEPVQDDVIIDQHHMRVDAFAAYFSDTGGTTEHRPIITLSEELGVAIEQLKSGFTISDLWKIDLE